MNALMLLQQELLSVRLEHKGSPVKMLCVFAAMVETQQCLVRLGVMDYRGVREMTGVTGGTHLIYLR
jgi:hypothetical protein